MGDVIDFELPSFNSAEPPKPPGSQSEEREPDWRHRQVELLLANGEHSSPAASPADPDVRDYLTSRLGFRVSQGPSGFVDCAHRENPRKGVASLIRGMSVAGYTIDEIAGYLLVDSDEIRIFLSLFWDVPPRTRSGIVWRLLKQPTTDSEKLLEKLVLAAALIRGRFGLEQLLCGVPRKKRIDHAKKGHFSEALARCVFIPTQSSSPEEVQKLEPYVAALKRVLMLDTTRSRPVPKKRFRAAMIAVAAGAPVIVLLRHEIPEQRLSKR